MSDPKNWNELLPTITNNKRFIPADEVVAKSPLTMPDDAGPEATGADGEDEQAASDEHTLSHDVPIPGALSGVIELDWIAETPILFGTQKTVTATIDGNEQTVRVTEPQRLHAGTDAPYVIPGSAQRGMLRQVLRIISKGRFGPFDDVRPARRDPSYQARQVKGYGRKTGWLLLEGGEWKLKNCPNDCVAYEKLGGLGDVLRGLVSHNLTDWHKEFEQTPFTFPTDSYLVISAGMWNKTGEMAFRAPGANVGTFDPKRDIPVFLDAYGKIGAKGIEPDSNLAVWVKEYLRIATAADAGNEKVVRDTFNLPAKVAEPALRPDNPPGIPVYYYEKDGRIIMGMTQIMRFPMQKAVGEMAENAQPAPDPSVRDWAEAMLGFVDDETGEALRGRIDFGFATMPAADAGIWPSEDKYLQVVQMQPRPGYSAFYLSRIKTVGDSASYDSENAKAAGRARYPIWNKAQFEKWMEQANDGYVKVLRDQQETTENPKGLHSYLKLIEQGARFAGRLRFHNLLPEELGALLWALSLGDDGAFTDARQPACHAHSAGRGRAFGFGALRPDNIRLSHVRQVSADKDCPGDHRVDDTGWQDWGKGLAGCFAKSISGKGDLAAFSKERPIARLRHFSQLGRDDSRLWLGVAAGGTPFTDYQRLREVAETGTLAGRSFEDRPPGGNRAWRKLPPAEQEKIRREGQQKANRVREGLKAIMRKDEDGYNLLDWGSEPQDDEGGPPGK